MRLYWPLGLLALASCAPSDDKIAKCEMKAESLYPMPAPEKPGDMTIDIHGLDRSTFITTCLRADGYNWTPENKKCAASDNIRTDRSCYRGIR